MSGRWLLILPLILGCSPSSSAHRLDQYLQATTLAIVKDRVTVQLRLTPGVAVAPQLLATLGVDAQDNLSPVAQTAYARRVHQDLVLSADAIPVPLRLTAAAFPTVAALREGQGDITLTFEATVPRSPGRHQLTFTNVHQPTSGVYLVNALVPDDPGVRIENQSRNADQSRYELDYSILGTESVKSVVGQAHRPPDDGWRVTEVFVYHGIHHILTGYDHLLFACALVLAVTSVSDLLKVVTAFTLAHSLTLTLAALDLVHVPAHVVEPLIAASILFVALQNIFWPGRSRGPGRLAVAFLFGLFHGLGFAGGLLDLMHQMPGTTVLLAILGFGIGVEIGQQLVLLPLLGLLTVLKRSAHRSGQRPTMLPLLQRVGSTLIAAAGSYYLGAALIGT